jgi:hypothetical protein
VGHVEIEDLDRWPTILTSLTDTLRRDYTIAHVTLQPELVLSDGTHAPDDALICSLDTEKRSPGLSRRPARDAQPADHHGHSH